MAESGAEQQRRLRTPASRVTLNAVPLTTAISAIQKHVSNRLDAESIGDRKIVGVIGSAPSRYSKSPPLWNAVFSDLSIHARYVPLDVAAQNLEALTAASRDCERLLGFNVTVPHKVAVMELLDEADPEAARIGAVNTVVRTQEGRLVGCNTDGAGFVASILEPQPGRSQSFIGPITGTTILLLGAGGSARAVAFQLAPLLNSGRLIICNRTAQHARDLAAALRSAGYNAEAITEDELARHAANAVLIVNSTIKGQGGDFSLEAYSALAPAAGQRARGSGSTNAFGEVKRNNEISFALASAIPPTVGFYDLIYHPEETVFLRHGRETGHRTMNGKAMIICQAAIALRERICAAELRGGGMDNDEVYRRIIKTMYAAW
jgi:shikimate dehydrogenase